MASLGVSWRLPGASWGILGRSWSLLGLVGPSLDGIGAACRRFGFWGGLWLSWSNRLEAEKDAGEQSQGQGILGRRWWRLEMFKMHCQPVDLSDFANYPSNAIGLEWFEGGAKHTTPLSS